MNWIRSVGNSCILWNYLSATSAGWRYVKGSQLKLLSLRKHWMIILLEKYLFTLVSCFLHNMMWVVIYFFITKRERCLLLNKNAEINIGKCVTSPIFADGSGRKGCIQQKYSNSCRKYKIQQHLEKKSFSPRSATYAIFSGSLWLALRLSLAHFPASGPLWFSLARCPAHFGSLWLSLACSLALFGSLLLALPLSSYLFA